MGNDSVPAISRRMFLTLAAGGIAGAPSLVGAKRGTILTAQEVVVRIQNRLGGEWKSSSSVDGFKAGDPSTPITGIVTTALASLDVLRTAVKQGANLVITCEPAFFSKADGPLPPAARLPGAPARGAIPSSPADPVFQAKSAFIQEHGLVVWRLNEHWFTQKPDPFAIGIAQVLGWSKFADQSDPAHITIPEISLAMLVSHVTKGMKSRGGMRIVGDPKLRVNTLGLLPGSTPLQASLAMLPHVDAILAGEVREWESVEYVRDTVALGGRKSLILLGRIVSEDPGMKVCAEWLKSVVPELTSTWCAAGDPYWRPAV